MPDVTTTPAVTVLMDEADRIAALHAATRESLAGDPPEMPAVWLYDERGSQLFEEITRLPEYYPTRSETAILRARASEIAARTEARVLIELGAGSSEKTRLLLDALTTVDTLERFVPLDVSEEALRASAREVADRYLVDVHAVVGDFERHIGDLPAGSPRLIAFLGGTIGNLDADRRGRLFGTVERALGQADSFLLGVDLVKNPDRIVAAYNDARGVTEAFIRNGLTAINRELGANIDASLLAYSATWDETLAQMDIGFVATDTQTVTVPALDLTFTLVPGDYLRSEISAKFTRPALTAELEAAGLKIETWWEDAASEFALLLARPSF